MNRYFIAVFITLCLGSQGLAQQKLQPAATFQGHVDRAQAVAFSPDGKLLASGGDDHSIILWDLAQGKPSAVLQGHRTTVSNLAFSPDGKLLASGIGAWDFTIKLWDVNTGKLRRSLEGCTSDVVSMTFSPDGKYLAACHGGGFDNVKLWDVASGKLLGSPTGGSEGRTLAFSHDGKLLAVAGRDKGVELWELSTGERKASWGLSAGVTGGVSFSPDDQWLAVGTTESVTLCDVGTGKEIRRCEKAAFFPKEVLFSPDGRNLVAAGSDWASATMWDVLSGKEVLRFQPAPSKAGNFGTPGIALSRDGTLIAAANRDSVVTVWHNPLSKLPPPAVKSGTRDASKPAAPAPRATKKQRDTDFQWFTGLSYPDTKDYPFVKVYTGFFGGSFQFSTKFSFGPEGSNQSTEFSQSPTAQKTIHGFLLEKTEDRFTVLTAGLAKEAFKIDPKAEVKDKTIRFEPADLKAYAAGVLKALRAPPKDEGWPPLIKESSPRLQSFVLAWACWRQGFDDLAADLHHEAGRMPFTGDQSAVPPLRELLADDLADIALQSIMTRYRQPEVSRAGILKDLEDKAKQLPECANHDGVRVLLPLVRRMVQEDADHAKKAKSFAKLSQQEQIAELTFQLRDQGDYVDPKYLVTHIRTFEDPIDHRIDHDPWPKAPNSPAQQLVKLGIAAAGQLITHLDDERLTRCMAEEWGSQQVTSLNAVLRVGDCAVLILERISGRKLSGKNRIPAETKRRILAWYAEVQKNGEKQTLIDGVSRGDGDSYGQALQLIAKFEMDALPAVEVGIKVAKDDEVRNWLLRAAGRLKGGNITLLAELKDGLSPSGRLEAAKILHRYGRPEAIEGMIALWDSEMMQKQEGRSRLLADIAYTLIATEQATAIQAVEKDLQKLPVGLRQDVAWNCSSALAPRDGNFVNPKRIESKVPADARNALERILLALLDDTEKDTNRFPSRRTCDIAAAAFNDISAALYAFNPDASVEERDQAIRAIKKVWLQTNKE